MQRAIEGCRDIPIGGATHRRQELPARNLAWPPRNNRRRETADGRSLFARAKEPRRWQGKTKNEGAARRTCHSGFLTMGHACCRAAAAATGRSNEVVVALAFQVSRVGGGGGRGAIPQENVQNARIYEKKKKRKAPICRTKLPTPASTASSSTELVRGGVLLVSDEESCRTTLRCQ